MYTVDELDELISRLKVRIARLKQQLGESQYELAILQEQHQKRASEPSLTTRPSRRYCIGDSVQSR